MATSAETAEAVRLDGRERPSWGWIRLGLAFATCATLLLEIVITRIFSVVLIYHFAFMAISLALFGLGLAAIVVYLFPEWFPRARLSLTTSLLALGFAASCVGAVAAFSTFVESMVVWPLPFGSVLGLFSIMAVPFFLSGLAVAVPISRCTERIGALYAADLLGAAVGAVLAIPVLAWVGGPLAVVFCGVLGCASAACFGIASGRRALGLVSTTALAACLGLVLVGNSAGLFSLSHSRLGPDRSVLYQGWNSFSRITVEGPYGRGSRWRLGRGAPAPGVVQGGRVREPTHLSVVIDGGAKTPMPRFTGRFEPLTYFKYDVTSLGYQVREPASALIIGSGGGRDILTARIFGVRSIRAVEINPLIVDVTRDRFRKFSGDPYALEGVEYTISDGRSFAAESTEHFDVVQLSAVDTFAASGGGAMALVEHSLYTVEAFKDYYDRLSGEGVLSVTHRWGLVEPQRALRTVDLVSQAWRERGVEDASRHVIVIGRTLAWGTLLASRRPFTDREIAEVQNLAANLGFGILYAPGLQTSLPAIRALFGEQREALLAAFPLAVGATTDDRPFFFFFDRPSDFLWRGLSSFAQAPESGKGTSAEAAAPTLIVRILVWLIGLNAILIFVVPLAIGRLRLGSARGSGRLLVYFAAIGLGFITVEIPLIQRYTLLLGQPIYAFALILGCVLVASGVGSWLTGRVPQDRLVQAGRLAIGLVIVGGLVHALVGSILIHGGLRLPLGARVALTLASVAPLGVVMGMPLPLGIRMLETRAPAAIAWAWGINGSLSVVGTIVAMMLSVMLGISWTLLFGTAVYGIALACAAAGRR